MMHFVVLLCKRRALWLGMLVSVFAFSACSSDDADESDAVYRQAQSMPPLQVPQGVEKPPKGSEYLDVPEKLNTGNIPDHLERPPAMDQAVLDEETAKEAAEAAKKASPGKAELAAETIYKPDNTQVVLIKAGMDTVWPRVAGAIKKTGFKVIDSNRGKHYYSISRSLEKLEVKDDPLKPLEVNTEVPKEEYFIYVEPKDSDTEISVRDKDGTIVGSALANQLLQQIKGYVASP
jgi:uncharacterized lipoprotein